jgi:hypothetical protein
MIWERRALIHTFEHNLMNRRGESVYELPSARKCLGFVIASLREALRAGANLA